MVNNVSTYSAVKLQATIEYLHKHEEMGDPVPTIEGLADVLEKGVKTIYNWEKEFPEFREVCERILAKQGRLLQSKGLRRETEPSITKLLLSANHNKREKTDTENKNYNANVEHKSIEEAIEAMEKLREGQT